MKKTDFKKEYKDLFHQTDKKVSFDVVPEFQYLSIDGKGHPENYSEFE